MALTVRVEVPPRDHEVLASWVRSPSIRAGLARRARIVLLAADGIGTNEIVRRTGASKPTVILWKRRYAAEGIGGLGDRPKPGKPRTVDDVAIVLATLEPPPERLGVTHWSSRLLAAELGISNVKVADVWQEWGLQPRRAESFKFSTDPQLEAKIRDVIGLNLNPPDKAGVICVDEKPQTQALERKAPELPSARGTRIGMALTKRYGPITAVDQLSFDIRPGVVTGFLGPNGSGKSTTMRLILGPGPADHGTVTVAGRAYRDLPFPLREVGALLEAKAFHPGRSARRTCGRWPPSNAIPPSRVDETLHIVGLQTAASRKAGQLSLGMAQRLGIAAALLGDPPVLILDEPVNGLDPEGIRWIRNLMKSLAAEGRTVFVSSHLIAEMALTAERLIVIGRGRLLADTTVAELSATNLSLEDAFLALTSGSAEFQAKGSTP